MVTITHPDTSTPETGIAMLERIRCMLGLSKAQMEQAIGARPGRRGLFVHDRYADPALIENATRLLRLYDKWGVGILRRAPQPPLALDVAGLAELLSITDNHAWRLAQRYLQEQPSDDPAVYGKQGAYTRRYRITKDDVRTLLAANSRRLPATGQILDGVEVREAASGPLSGAFLRWVTQQAKET